MIVNTVMFQKENGDPVEWSFSSYEREARPPITFLEVNHVLPRISIKGQIGDWDVSPISSKTTDMGDVFVMKKYENPNKMYLKVDNRYMNLGLENVKKSKAPGTRASDVVVILHHYDMYRYDLSKDMKIQRVVNTRDLQGFVAEVPSNANWEAHILVRRRDLKDGSPEWGILEVSKKKNSKEGVLCRAEYHNKIPDVISRFTARAVTSKDMRLTGIDENAYAISKEFSPWAYKRYGDDLKAPPTKYIVYHKSSEVKRKLTRLIENKLSKETGIQYELVEYESNAMWELGRKCNAVTLYAVEFAPTDHRLSHFKYLFVMSKSGHTTVIKES